MTAKILLVKKIKEDKKYIFVNSDTFQNDFYNLLFITSHTPITVWDLFPSMKKGGPVKQRSNTT